MRTANRQVTRASIWKFGRNRRTATGNASLICSTPICRRVAPNRLSQRVDPSRRVVVLSCVTKGSAVLKLFDQQHAIDLIFGAECSDRNQVQVHLVARLELLIEVLRDWSRGRDPVFAGAVLV